MTTQITVLTFNLWGIFNSKHRAARMSHFATKVERYDVIMLQEQFSEEDFEHILSCIPPAVRQTRFFQRFPSAFYGSGIAVISRFPIVSTVFSVFPLQGYPERVLHGDYYANKGAALVRIRVPCATSTADGSTGLEQRDVFVYSTHFVAVYEKTSRLRNWRDELYLPVRVSQAVSFADFISSTSRPTDHVIIGGDFNASQRSLEIQTMLVLLRQRGYRLSSVLPASSVRYTTVHGGANAIDTSTLTFSDANMFNSTKAGWLVEGGDVPCQIDHMFVTSNTLRICKYDDCPDLAANHQSPGTANSAKSPTGVVVFTKNDEVPLPQQPSRFSMIIDSLCAICRAINCPIPSQVMQWKAGNVENNAESGFCALSDHYGVAVRLQLLPLTSATVAPDDNKDEDLVLTPREVAVLREAADFLELSANRMRHESRVCLRFVAISSAVVVGNFFLLWYQARQKERHTERVLEHLLTSSNACKSSGWNRTPPRSGEAGSLTQWFFKDLPGILASPEKAATGGGGGGAAGEPIMKYSEIAARIHHTGVWHAISPIIYVGSTLFGVGSLLTGLLQRSGNAKIMAEQRGAEVDACAMPKRSRSVLHAYVLPPARRPRDGWRPTRDASPPAKDEGSLQLLPLASAAGDPNGPAAHPSSAGAAAFDTNDEIRGAASLKMHCGDAMYNSTCHTDGCCSSPTPSSIMVLEVDDGNATEGIDGPFIPEADRLAGLPPSCRIVQSEPNWLERALMLARCSNRRICSPAMNGSTDLWGVTAPPDPSCLHLDSTVGEEGRRAVAVASIAAAFYSSLRYVTPVVYRCSDATS